MFGLKLLTVTFVILHAALSGKIGEDAAEFYKSISKSPTIGCLLEAGLTPDDLQPIFDNGRLPQTEEMGCYFRCLYEKLNIMDPYGNVNQSALINEEAPYLTPEATERCARETWSGRAPCKKAYILANCIAKSQTI